MHSVVLRLLCSSAILVSISYVKLEDSASCKPGYVKQKGMCEDINECYTALKPCGDHSQCINLEGSYKCQCDEDYQDTTLDGMNCKLDLSFKETKEQKKYLILGLSAAFVVLFLLGLIACCWLTRKWKKQAMDSREQKWAETFGYNDDDDSDSSS